MENTHLVSTAVAGMVAALRKALPTLLLCLGGCVASPDFAGEPATMSVQDFPLAQSRDTIRLTPGDTILVKFTYWPELDQEQLIRPDGKISLQLIGHIDVAGMTLESLDAHLHELYENKIKQPAITTFVTAFGNRRAYVGGEVARPGYIELTDNMTALEAVMSAGGFEKVSANLSDVVVVRHHEGQRYAKLLDLDQPVANSGSNMLVAPRDIIYVPRTRIDEVNQWVDQYISRVIPGPVWTYAIVSEQ